MTDSDSRSIARFITFEGIDGSGKSTQLRLLANVLRERGFTVVTTREPGGTPLGVRLRQALLDVQAEVDPLAELLLYAADRAQHVRTLIRPALANDSIVLSDRYSDATVAYQGAGRGFPSNLINQVVALATDGLRPDLTLVFDMPIAAARARQARRAQPSSNASTSHNTKRMTRHADRLDLEDNDFYHRVQTAYHQLAASEPDRVRLVEASSTIEEIHRRVLEIVMPMIEENGNTGDRIDEEKRNTEY